MPKDSAPGGVQGEYMVMDDYGDEDEVRCLAFRPCSWSLVLLGSVSYSFAGVAGVDGQNQRETREGHQTAGTGGQTRQRSRRERPHLLQVARAEKPSRQRVNSKASIGLS